MKGLIQLKKFQEIIEYTFKNEKILSEALAHSSFANENKKMIKSNERLEFLGDSVLSLVVAEYLFSHYKNFPEGELTRIRASLVCEKTLFKFAKQINLGEYIKLGKGEAHTKGNERPSILSDAFEAVIAAIYLDGGYENAKKHILKFVENELQELNTSSISDFKTALQEIIQKNPEEKVEYFLLSESGPDHDKAFTVQVKLNRNVIGTGVGKSKKNAEQMAAKEALELMGYVS